MSVRRPRRDAVDGTSATGGSECPCQQLRALLGHLTERERDIIDSRFGFERPAEKLTTIGSRLGISAERVRQIEERALTKMRQRTQP
jgi:RNA polymerase sigma factor (sigma-70 family)